jgi:hypothetical protein
MKYDLDQNVSYLNIVSTSEKFLVIFLGEIV